MSRYDRQMILPEIAADGQSKLADAHVLVIGAGGLGVPVLQYLAGAGIGHIKIVDPDEVSFSNLHRQTLYSEDILGEAKAEAAAKILCKLNSDITIEPIVASLDPGNIGDFAKQATIILDCADSFVVSYILSDYCLENNIPLISASALALSGYVGGFCGGAPSLRALFPNLPDQAGNCATAGVLGPIVGTIGALQAQMAMAVLLDIKPSPLGQLVRFDGKTFRFSSFRFDNAPEPTRSILKFIAPSELSTSDYIIELRDKVEAPELLRAHAKRFEVDAYSPENLLPEETEKRAVFVCRSGLRAHRAAVKLQKIWDGEIVLVAVG